MLKKGRAEAAKKAQQRAVALAGEESKNPVLFGRAAPRSQPDSVQFEASVQEPKKPKQSQWNTGPKAETKKK